MNTFISLRDFIAASKTQYHTVSEIKSQLLSSGYTELSEYDVAAFQKAGKYFVTRNASSLIAFHVCDEKNGFMISASHSDTPTFKVKSVRDRSGYLSFNVEKYGGAIHYSWLDRPLSLAGRVVLRTEGGIQTRLVDIDRDLAVIPSLAIHMNRNVNDGAKLSPNDDMLPLVGPSGSPLKLEGLIADSLGVDPTAVISHDLFLYNRECARTFGTDGGYVLSPRLDDLECTFAALTAFVSSESDSASVPVLAVFDNEEVGSETKQGAASTFLYDTLRKIAGSDDKLFSMLAASFMVSADNAHAVHPNHPELADRVGAPTLGGGVVIKYNSNQRYATDSVSDALFRILAERAGSPVQTFYSRPDMPCGSTLGSISNTRVSIPTVDIGLAQLAMHSATETAALSDLDALISVFGQLFAASLTPSVDGYSIR